MHSIVFQLSFSHLCNSIAYNFRHTFPIALSYLLQQLNLMRIVHSGLIVKMDTNTEISYCIIKVTRTCVTTKLNSFGQILRAIGQARDNTQRIMIQTDLLFRPKFRIYKLSLITDQITHSRKRSRAKTKLQKISWIFFERCTNSGIIVNLFNFQSRHKQIISDENDCIKSCCCWWRNSRTVCC